MARPRAACCWGFGEVSGPIRIEVHSAAVITGRVVVDDGDAPCSSGIVGLHDERQQLAASGKIAADGSAEVFAVLTWSISRAGFV